jgi:hypothetical protein
MQAGSIQAKMNESIRQLMHRSPRSVLATFVQNFQSGWEELRAGSWTAIQAENSPDEELHSAIERAHENLLSLESLSQECVANHLDIDSCELDILMTITHDLLVPLRHAKGFCAILMMKDEPDKLQALQRLRQLLNGIDRIVKNL